MCIFSKKIHEQPPCGGGGNEKSKALGPGTVLSVFNIEVYGARMMVVYNYTIKLLTYGLRAPCTSTIIYNI